MKKQSFAMFCLCLFACSLLACGGSGSVYSEESVGTVHNVGNSATAEDTTSAPTTLPDGECVHELVIDPVSHANSVVHAGDTGVVTMIFKLSAPTCSDLEIKYLSFLLSTPDADPEDQTPFCAEPCGLEDRNFRNFKVLNVQDQHTVMGPVEFKQLAVNQPARLDFLDPLVLEAGTSVTLALVMDIADPLVTPIQGMRFNASLLGVDAEPLDYTTINLPYPEGYIVVQ